MNAWDRQTTVAQSQGRTIDQGLRSYMLKVYNYMASGVLLTGIIAYFAGTSSEFMNALYTQHADGSMGMSGLGYLVTFAPLAMAFFMMVRLGRMSTQALHTTFWVYAGLMGLMLSSLFLAYTGESIARVLFVTAGTFGLLSIFGYSTKRDLTSIGTFAWVGMWAVLISSLVNVFLLHSTVFQTGLSALGVVVALAFTAYDTQKIKDIYAQVGYNADALQRATIMGALKLYMDFLYLFINLMQLMGNRR